MNCFMVSEVGSRTLALSAVTSGGSDLYGVFIIMISFRSCNLSHLFCDVTLLFITNVVLSFQLCSSSAGDRVW